MRNYCVRCEVDFPTIGLFDGHPCIVNPQGLEVARERRRTSAIEMINAATGHLDTIQVCDPDCRNEFLQGLGIPCRGNSYPASGHAAVEVKWNQQLYDVTWKRNRPSGGVCMACGHDWRYRETTQRAITAPPTANQLAARAKFRDKFGGTK